jgi:hypothetical protein
MEIKIFKTDFGLFNPPIGNQFERSRQKFRGNWAIEIDGVTYYGATSREDLEKHIKLI